MVASKIRGPSDDQADHQVMIQSDTHDDCQVQIVRNDLNDPYSNYSLKFHYKGLTSQCQAENKSVHFSGPAKFLEKLKLFINGNLKLIKCDFTGNNHLTFKRISTRQIPVLDYKIFSSAADGQAFGLTGQFPVQNSLDQILNPFQMLFS